MQKSTLFCWLLALLLVVACNHSQKPKNVSQKHQPKAQEQLDKAKQQEAEAKSIDTLTMLPSKLQPEKAQAIIEAKSKEVLQLIGQKAFATLSKQYIHPVHGLRFSPYSYVNLKKDQVYAATHLMHAWADSSVINWGVQDGSGEPISLSFPDYYDRYIYNKDYQTSSKIKYNDTEGTGNMIDNWRKVYPNAIMIEYYLDGTNPDFGGLDWGSLRLFFEAHRGKWWLVGIAHGEWTT